MITDVINPPQSGERLSKHPHTIYFINRHSTNSQLYYDECFNRYLDHAEDATWIDTTVDGQCTDQLLAEVASHDQPELIIGGGDGTLHMAVEALIAGFMPEELARIDPVINVIGIGNENDVAKMLHGTSYDNIDHVQNGNIQRVRLLMLERQVKHELPGGNFDSWQHAHAIVYSFGAGATAEGARLANEPGYPPQNARDPESYFGRLEHKAALYVAKLQLGRRAMRATYEGRNGHKNDLTVANGSRMAGIFRFPSRLNQSGFFVSETNDSFLGRVISLSDRFVGIGYSGVLLDGIYYFDLTEDTLVNVDGETYTLQPGAYRLQEGPVALAFRGAYEGAG